jgi:EAL domain-containing protein (putative c-di-GMP-specific phosphodiesterase class I)
MVAQQSAAARIAPMAEDDFLARADKALTGWADPAAHLRTALEKDDFELYCQPMLALSGAAAGTYPLGEVLVRLREEETSLLPPGEFLPAFEHYRMMPELDRWVVRHAVKRLLAGSRIHCLTLNISTQTLADAEFPKFVSKQLGMNQVPAERLAFEIDESDTLAQPEAALRFAVAARAAGCRLLLDGFGRRSVSFAAIKALGVNFVKVDGSITRKLLAGDGARAKFDATLRVGEALGFAVVAECVEEQEILDELKAMDVGFAQGFGIHPPRPIASVPS